MVGLARRRVILLRESQRIGKISKKQDDHTHWHSSCIAFKLMASQQKPNKERTVALQVGATLLDSPNHSLSRTFSASSKATSPTTIRQPNFPLQRPCENSLSRLSTTDAIGKSPKAEREADHAAGAITMEDKFVDVVA